MDHMVLGVVILGISLAEWFGIIGLIGTILTTVFTLLKKVVVNPIVVELHRLSEAIENIDTRVSDNEKSSASSRQEIHNRVNRSNSRLDKVETRLDFVEEDIRELKK